MCVQGRRGRRKREPGEEHVLGACTMDTLQTPALVHQTFTSLMAWMGIFCCLEGERRTEATKKQGGSFSLGKQQTNTPRWLMPDARPSFFFFLSFSLSLSLSVLLTPWFKLYSLRKLFRDDWDAAEATAFLNKSNMRNTGAAATAAGLAYVNAHRGFNLSFSSAG